MAHRVRFPETIRINDQDGNNITPGFDLKFLVIFCNPSLAAIVNPVNVSNILTILMRSSVLLCFLLIASSIYAQSIQKEINDQVWAPFLKAYAQNDVDLFMSVHHRDVLRIPQDENIVMRFKDYHHQMDKVNRYNLEKGNQVKLDLRFTQRLAEGDRAFETGFYAYQHTNAQGQVNIYYGKFHVVLVREDNLWKIWLDADTSAGADEASYKAARALTDF